MSASGLLRPPAPGAFTEAELDGLPSPVQRHLVAAIAPGAPLARSARLRMRGRIKLGRWLPFRAQQVLDPHRGFVWAGRVAGVITGSDRLVNGAGVLDWRLLGHVTVAHAEGGDVTRSAAGRAGAEAIWLPTALLPRFGARWSATGPDQVVVAHEVGGTGVEVGYRLDAAGRIRSFSFDRWGDPGRTGTWGWHPFGGEVTAYRTFDGISVPSQGLVGWYFGTGRWPDGAFFRYELTDLRPVT